MSQKPSYYDLLEVETSADPEKVKAAYRRLARKYHPDMNPGNPDAESRFKKIGEAYAVLSDPDKRKSYDQSLGILNMARSQRSSHKSDNRSGQRSSTATPGTGKGSQSKVSPRAKASSATAGPTVDTQGTRFKEMFDALFQKDDKQPGADKKSKPSVAGQDRSPPPPPPKKPSAPPPVRGEDITVEAVITREEAESGVIKTVNVQHTETCKRCSGTGRVNGVLCQVCHGDKQLVTLRKIDVRVPAGVKSGSKVRVAKEGGKGHSGGDPGDLFLLIRLADNAALKIDGLNVTSEVPISIVEAVLGSEIEVATLHGKVKMVVPPLTSSGRVLKLKGQGVTTGGATGDHYVTVQIVAPKTLSAKEKALYEELKRLHKDAPRS